MPYPYARLHTLIQLWQFREDIQSCPHRAGRIVFMRLGIAEVHQQPIADVLGQIPLKAADDASAGLPIRLDDHP